jgi:hypothetical protein
MQNVELVHYSKQIAHIYVTLSSHHFILQANAFKCTYFRISSFPGNCISTWNHCELVYFK